MTWTFSNFLIHIGAGILGAHAVASALHDHRFGFVGHTLAGLLGGILSGYFFQELAVTMVTASGSLNEPTLGENIILQALAGAASGACAMLFVGFAKHAIDDHRAKKG
jgi:uncharacterized membrane protein YeaQ/YmgE (transglycosylase-associated protein family)